MVNQVIPFMEFCVENDPCREFVQVSVGDFPACLVNLFDHTGEDLQPGFGHGFSSSIAGISNREDWCSAPRTGYLGEEPVFNGVVFGAVRRVMHHYYLETNSFRKSHEVLFYDVVGTGVGAAAVTEYHQHPGIRVDCAQMLSPAGFNVVAHVLGCVMAGAYGEVSGVVRDVVYAVRDNGTVGENREVVVERLGRSRAEDGSLPLEVADEFLLLRVDADNRDAGVDTYLPDMADFLKLRVPAFNLSHRDVLSERPRFETALNDKLSDEVVGDVNAPFFEFASYFRSFDVEPHDAFVLRISGHVFGCHLKKCFLPFRVGVGFLLCTASRLADSAALKARFVTKFMNSFDNRSCGNSQKRAQRPYRTTIVPDRFACNKKPSVAFVKSHKERFLFFCNVYWRFLLHICNFLLFTYKYMK